MDNWKQYAAESDMQPQYVLAWAPKRQIAAELSLFAQQKRSLSWNILCSCPWRPFLICLFLEIRSGCIVCPATDMDSVSKNIQIQWKRHSFLQKKKNTLSFPVYSYTMKRYSEKFFINGYMQARARTLSCCRVHFRNRPRNGMGLLKSILLGSDCIYFWMTGTLLVQPAPCPK